MKLDFPRFKGGDPTAWISKANQYFDYNGTPKDQKVQFTSYHMEDEASEWWQAISKALREDGVVTTWPVFEEELWVQFGPAEGEDFDEALSKIQQTGTLQEYQREFERLQNKVEGWTQKALIGTYVGGLNPEIADSVRMFRPKSLKEVLNLARMRDDQMQRQRKKFSNRAPPYRSFTATNQNRGTPTKAVEQLAQDTPPRHKCKQQQLFVMEGEDDDEEEDSDNGEEQEKAPEIIAYALTGWNTPQTIRLAARVGKREIIALVDSGSTHNFVSEKTARELKLPLKSIKPFPVKVADGKPLRCRGRFDMVMVWLGDVDFTVTLYALPLEGLDLVLGVQWLSSLGPILCDWKEQTMEFEWEGKKHNLQGVHAGIKIANPQEIDVETAFTALKMALTTTPTLALPNFSIPFVIETDASGDGIGAVLSQQGRPIAFMSRFLGVAKRSWYTYAREMLAIVVAIRTWRPYLLGYDYEITYKPGKTNNAADALSRVAGSPVLNAVSIKQTSLWDDIRAMTKTDDYMKRIGSLADSNPGNPYSWQNNLICYHNRVVVPPTSPLVSQLLREHHDTPMGGTQEAKSTSLAPAGLLQPLPVPDQIWEDVSMDFIDGLPHSDGHTTIMVVVDMLTKSAHLVPLAHRRLIIHYRTDKLRWSIGVLSSFFDTLSSTGPSSGVRFFHGLNFAHKYFGPFQVEAHIGEVAYRLALPSGSRIHPVFHVSLLKQHIGSLTPVPGQLPTLRENGYLYLQPETVLRKRTIRAGEKDIKELLIKWKDLPREDTTWEEEEQLEGSFPEFVPNLEDKAVVRGRGIDGPQHSSRLIWILSNERESRNRYSRIFVDACLFKPLEFMQKKIIELRADIANCRQNGDTVMVYYGRLKKMWDELAIYKPIRSCSCGELAAQLEEDRNEERTNTFLHGLDSTKFGTVHSTITSMEPLPKLSQVYQRIIREERQLTITRNRDATPEAVGFAVQAAQRGQTSNFYREKDENEVVTTMIAVEVYVDVEAGLDVVAGPVVGLTQSGVFRQILLGDIQANSTRTPADLDRQSLPQMSDDQWNALKSLFASQKSNPNEKLNGKKECIDFIIDTGASHHMTGNLDYLSNVMNTNPCMIGLPDGDHVVSTQQGDICLGGDLWLQGDRTMKTLIGVGEECGDVYVLRGVIGAKIHKTVSCSGSWDLWHRRLGHPSSRVVPYLLSNLDIKKQSAEPRSIHLVQGSIDPLHVDDELFFPGTFGSIDPMHGSIDPPQHRRHGETEKDGSIDPPPGSIDPLPGTSCSDNLGSEGTGKSLVTALDKRESVEKSGNDNLKGTVLKVRQSEREKKLLGHLKEYVLHTTCCSSGHPTLSPTSSQSASSGPAKKEPKNEQMVPTETVAGSAIQEANGGALRMANKALKSVGNCFLNYSSKRVITAMAGGMDAVVTFSPNKVYHCLKDYTKKSCVNGRRTFPCESL
ncbi:unnamed protein product [Arabidopsis halleri]